MREVKDGDPMVSADRRRAVLGACGGDGDGSGGGDGNTGCESNADCPDGQACTAAGRCAPVVDGGKEEACTTEVPVPWPQAGNFCQVSWSEIDFVIGLFDAGGGYDVGSYSIKLG